VNDGYYPGTRTSATGYCVMLALVAGVALLVLIAARDQPPALTIAQRCLLESGGYLRVQPGTLNSRFDEETNELAVKADFGRRLAPRYGLCVLSGAEIDTAATARAVARLVRLGEQDCLAAPVSDTPGSGTNGFRSGLSWLRDPTAVEIARRRAGECARFDRDSLWVKWRLEWHYDSKARRLEQSVPMPPAHAPPRP